VLILSKFSVCSQSAKPAPCDKLGVRHLLSLAFALGIATHAQAAEPTESASRVVTEAELIDAALRTPSLVERQQAEVDLAGADRLAVRRWPNPQVQYAREQIVSPRAQGEDYLTVSQTFDISGHRMLRGEAATQRIEATKQEMAVDRAALVADLRQAYARTLHAQARERVCTQWHAYLEESVAIARARVGGGEDSRFDVLRVEQELEQATTQLELIQDDRMAGWTELRALALDTSLPIQPSELAGPLAPEAREAGELDVPELRALELEAAAADRELDAARRVWVPGLTLSLGYKGVQAVPQRSDGFVASVGFAIPLFDFGRADRRRTQAELARTRAELTWTRERLETEREGLDARLKAFSPSPEGPSELVEVARVAYIGGEIDTVELLDTYRAWMDGETSDLDRALAARLASIELDRLEGRVEP
jgi:cobalt-zinc-cadmium efflux system outer membrane protein